MRIRCFNFMLWHGEACCIGKSLGNVQLDLVSTVTLQMFCFLFDWECIHIQVEIENHRKGPFLDEIIIMISITDAFLQTSD